MTLRNFVMHKCLLSTVVFGCAVALLAVNAFAGNTAAPSGTGGSTSLKPHPDVEPTMCQIQVRWHYIAYPDYYKWNVKVCGGDIPPFPDNECLDETDPKQFVEYVRKVVVAMYLASCGGGAPLPYHFLEDDPEGKEHWPGPFQPKGDGKCKIPTYGDYGEAPYSGGDYNDENATVHINNAEAWLGQIAKDLGGMDKLGIPGDGIVQNLLRGGRMYGMYGSDFDYVDSMDEGWLFIEDIVQNDWQEHKEMDWYVYDITGLHGIKYMAMGKYETDDPSSYYFPKYLELYEAFLIIYSSDTLFGPDFTSWSSENRGGVDCEIDVYHKLAEYSEGVGFEPAITVDRKFHFYKTCDPIKNEPVSYQNTWSMPDPHEISNPVLEFTEPYSDIQYEINGNVYYERYYHDHQNIDVGWKLIDGMCVIRPDFSIPVTAKSCNNSGCTGGTCSLTGNGNHNNNCVDVRYSLGTTLDGNFIGSLRLFSLLESLDLSQPQGLIVSLNEDYDTGSEAIYDDDVIRQIKTPIELVDIQVDAANAYKYTIRRYDLEHVGVKDADGLYVINAGEEGQWNWQYTIQNPDYDPTGDDVSTTDIDEGLTDYNRLLITEDFEGDNANAKSYIYDRDKPSSTWRLGELYDMAASGAAYDFESQVAERWKIVQEIEVDGITIVTRQTLNKDHEVLEKSVAKYKKHNDEYVLLEAVHGDDQNLVERNVHYDNAHIDGALYGKLRYSIDTNGHWKRYLYNSSGFLSKIIEQIDNQPIDADESLCKVTEALENGVSVKYKTLEVSQTYNIYDGPIGGFRTIRDIQCTVPGATIDDSSNLITTTKLYYGGDKDGEVHSIIYPDGSVYASLDSETDHGDGSTTTVSYSGTPNDSDNPTSIIDGTKTESFTDVEGRSVWYKTYDIQSNVLLSHTLNTEVDEFGRVLRSEDVIRGTYTTSSYGCCHLDATTDESGIVTTYGYDSLDRQETVTRNGITSYATYDVADRMLSQSRVPSDGPAILQSTMGYDMIGRLLTQTDVDGNVTTYTYTTDPDGRRVEIATVPNGATVVNTYNQDGTMYKSSGSANATTYYEYGVAQAPIVGNPTLQYTKVIRMGDGGILTQWEMSFTDMLGRSVCTVYSDATPGDLTDNPIATNYYDDTPGSTFGAGKLFKTVDPDGIATLYAYNDDGEQNVTAVDLNVNGIIDYGIDRITRSDSMILAQGMFDTSVAVRRSESYIWTDADLTVEAGTLTSYSESSLDGYQSWSVTLANGVELVTHTQTELQRKDESQNIDALQATTTTNPDGSYSVSITRNGYLESTTSYDADDVILTQQTYTYDDHGRQYQVADLRTATAGSTTYTYNDADQIIAMTTVDPDGAGPLTAQTTRFTYDEMGRQTKIDLPDGTSQHRRYTLRGQLAKSWGASGTSGGGYPVEYTYDTQGRRKTLTTWKDFNQSSGTGVNGQDATTTWDYDPYRGNMVEKTYADGKGTTYTYTDSGKLKTRTWQRGIIATYSYDTTGQLLGVDYSDDTQDIAYSYDRLGRRDTTIDAAGQTTYAYVDAFNSLVTSMTTTDGGTSGGDVLAGTQVSYAYDSLLRRQAVTASQLVDDVMTSFTTTGYTYDSASRLKSVTDGVNFATYNYLANSGNMIDNVIYAVDATVGVNDDGQQLPTQNMFTTTKSYDQLGRFVSHQSIRDSDSKVLSSYGYTYNQRGQRAQAQMTDGSYWDYQYDNLGQLTGAAKFTSAGKILPGYQYNYQYDQIGNRTKASSGGDAFGLNQRETNYHTNNLNQYEQINNHPCTNVTGQAHADATVTVQLDENQPATALKPGGFRPQASASDLEKRTAQTSRLEIPDSDDAYFHAEFELDRTTTSGGRTELDMTVTGVRNNQGTNADQDAIDSQAITRQIPASTVTLSYDDDGNILSDDRWTYVWNGENRLIELRPKPIYRADGNILSKRLEFIYDAQGRRIEKRVYIYNATSTQHDTLESITRFIYDGWLLIAELHKPADEPLPSGDSAGQPLRTYTHGLDLSGTPQGAGGIAGLLFMRTHDNSGGDDEVYAYCYDGNGNVTELFNLPKPADELLPGAILRGPSATYEYSPFGQLIRTTGNAANKNPFQFSTKYTDPETGFNYYGYRYYDISLGKWLGNDPASDIAFISIFRLTLDYGLWPFYNKQLMAFSAKISFFREEMTLFNSNDPVGNYDYNGLWVVCCDPVQKYYLGYYAFANHCEINQGSKCSSTYSTAYPIWRDYTNSRTMGLGDEANRSCKCAKANGVGSCLAAIGKSSADPNRPYDAFKNNCQSAVEKQLSECCLISTWRPQTLYGGDYQARTCRKYVLFGKDWNTFSNWQQNLLLQSDIYPTCVEWYWGTGPVGSSCSSRGK